MITPRYTPVRLLRRLALAVPALLPAAGACWARYALIEAHAQAQACLAGAPGARCVLRSALVVLIHADALSALALLASGLALFWRHPHGAALALGCGALALVLYSPQSGALAVLVGGLLLLPSARPTTSAASSRPSPSQHQA